MPAKRTKIPDDQLLDEVLAYFDDHGLLKTISDGRGASTAFRHIKRACEKHLVRLVPVPQPLDKSELDDDLAQQVKDAFDLNQVRILNIASADQADEQKDRRFDDHVHRKLGQLAAGAISDSPMFRRGDVVGIGSGRGVYYTVATLKDFKPLPTEDITLISLTGALYARNHALDLTRCLDADYHVALLAVCFKNSVRTYTIPDAIANNESKISEIRRATVLHTARWPHVHHALLGVGVLSRGHRFWEEANAPLKDQEPRLDPIRAPLKDLVAKCDEIGKKFQGTHYCPAADIGNSLFFVRPPKSVSLAPGDESLIRDKIDKINSLLLNVSKQQLQSIDSLILVAGTKKKTLAIQELLTSREYQIRYLYTDSQTAKTILADRDAPNHGE